MTTFNNVLTSSSFDDLLFTNRNKEYGAYILRTKQRKYVIIAFLAAFLMVCSTVAIPYILNRFKEINPLHDNAGFVVMDMDSTLDFVPPKPPEIDLAPLNNTLTVPIVTFDADTIKPSEFGTMDDFINNGQPLPPPTDIVAVVETDPVIEVEQELVIVEIPATFKGGNLDDFNKWVLQNIKYPQIAIENQISGRVFIQFVVNSKGKVENVKVLRGVDPSLDDEAVRVIKSSPLWTPPLQGGRPVKQIFSLPVSFKMQ